MNIDNVKKSAEEYLKYIINSLSPEEFKVFIKNTKKLYNWNQKAVAKRKKMFQKRREVAEKWNNGK